MVAFESDVEMRSACNLFQVELPACDEWPFLWRFGAYIRHGCCSRSLRRARLSAPDIVIGGEHLFLREHARMFPGVPWIYLPHSLLLHHEIDSYQLSPTVRWL